MIGAGALHRTQALAGGIGLVQGRPNRLAILSGDQGVGRAEHTGEPRLDLGQQSERGFPTSRPHPAHAGSIEIKSRRHSGQRGQQERGMLPQKQKPTTWMAAAGWRARNQANAAETSPRI